MQMPPVFTAVSCFAQRHPVTFACLIAGPKSSFLDFCVQHYAEGRTIYDIDTRRNLAFFSFGVVYLGSWHTILYLILGQTSRAEAIATYNDLVKWMMPAWCVCASSKACVGFLPT